jgi:hypothetical protein
MCCTHIICFIQNKRKMTSWSINEYIRICTELCILLSSDTSSHRIMWPRCCSAFYGKLWCWWPRTIHSLSEFVWTVASEIVRHLDTSLKTGFDHILTTQKLPKCLFYILHNNINMHIRSNCHLLHAKATHMQTMFRYMI